MASKMKVALRHFLLAVLLMTHESPSIATTDSSSHEQSYPVHDVRNCHTAVRRLEVLPGLGFDNLRNLDMGQVHFYNYSTCKETEDGKYVIPDSAFVIPLQEGHYKFFADYFDHWDNYTSITSSKVNVEFEGLFSKISGSFSREKQSVKENQVNFNSKTTRTTFRNRVYLVYLNPASELHPTFKSKIYEISASVQNNDTELTRFLSELLVRDYGTHFIRSVEAGAVFVKLDSISETYARNVDTNTVTSAASASFPMVQLLGSGSFSLDYNRNTTQVDAYKTSLKRSEILTIGGASLTPDLNVTTWVSDVPNKLATIDRRGDPLHYAVTSTQFPELPGPTVRTVADSIWEAMNRYYRLNTRPGCVDPKAPNFDFQANFDDSTYCNTAQYSHIDMVFGGIYQTCHQSGREDLCGDRQIPQVNPQTGNYACPAGYTAVSLYNGTQTHTGVYRAYRRTCNWIGQCRTRGYDVTGTTFAYYETFWCVLLNTSAQYRGYLFGGYFTPSTSNPITGTQSCPPYYRIQKIAVDVSICISNDYELGFPHAISFAGFQSCRVGNPLAVPASVQVFPAASDWPYACPRGYSQHLVAVESGCEINVCLENGAFQPKSLLPAHLPPFQTNPPYVPYTTEKLTVIGSEGSIIVRNTAGQWKIFSSESEEASFYYEMFAGNKTEPENNTTTSSQVEYPDPDDDSINNTAIVSLALSTVAIASVIVITLSLLTFKVCSRRQRNRNIPDNVLMQH